MQKTYLQNEQNKLGKIFPETIYFAPCGVGGFNFPVQGVRITEQQIRSLVKLGYFVSQAEVFDGRLHVWLKLIRSYDEDFGKLLERENV